METRASLTAMKAERKALTLPVCIITKCHALIKTADTTAPHVFADTDAL